MDSVIAGIDRDLPAADGDVTGRVDRIVRRCDVQGSRLYVQVTVFHFIGGDNAVISGLRGDGSFFDANAVIGVNGICCRCYCNRSAGDDKVIVGGYSVPVFCVYCKASAAVDRQIVVRVDRSVCSV